MLKLWRRCGEVRHRTALVAVATGLSAVSAAPAMAEAVDPRKHKHFGTLNTAFAQMLAKPRPLEEKCTVITGSTGIAAVDAILKPYLARQAELTDGAARFPIVDCRYSARRHGYDGRVIMMNPPASQIATWIVSACVTSGMRREGLSEDACLAKAARMIWLQTSAQFPITGYVPEPASACPGSPPGPRRAMFGFRDGVAAALAGTPNEAGNPPKNPCGETAPIAATCTTVAISKAQIDAALGADVTKLPKPAYARLANLPMKILVPTTDANRCPLPDGAPFEWLTRARTSYLDALGADTYSFLNQYVSIRDDDPRFTCKRIGDSKLLGAC